MNSLRKVKDIFKKMNFILTATQKRYAALVLAMGLIASVLEMVGVAAIMPVLDMLLNIQGVRERWYLKDMISILHLQSDMQIVWLICALVMGVYGLKNLYFSFYSWVSQKFAYKVQRELGVRILGAYMRQGYSFFVENNTSKLQYGISGDVNSIYNILNVFFSSSTKTLTIVCIVIFIAVQSPQIAAVVMGLAVLCLMVVQIIYRKSMSRNGKLRKELLVKNGQISLEAIQGNKEVLVMHKQDFFVKMYGESLAELNKTCVKIDMGTILPSYIIETICIVGLMFVVGVQMGITDNVGLLITQLSTIAVGAFRILPALGGVTGGINSIIMSTSQLESAYQTIAQVKELEKNDAGRQEIESQYRDIKFEKEIGLHNISFRYPNAEEPVLENVNLTIKKGESIAFIGQSGAGKTTISDIILALLKPTKGIVTMDGIDVEMLGKEWNRIIGYVPQMTYIVDDTIRHNIAFGEKEEDIDDEKVWKAVEIAQLGDFVRSLPKGIHTRVGERGIRFSGGQRQRVAIARALYREPDILVLDEATAALDNETESEVMRAIEALQGYKTLIIVAHRLTTVRKCDMIYEVRNKGVYVKDKGKILENS